MELESIIIKETLHEKDTQSSLKYKDLQMSKLLLLISFFRASKLSTAHLKVFRVPHYRLGRELA